MFKIVRQVASDNWPNATQKRATLFDDLTDGIKRRLEIVIM